MSQTGSQHPSCKPGGWTRWSSKSLSAPKIPRLPLWPDGNKQGRLMAKYHAPAFLPPCFTHGAISIPKSAVGNRKRSGIVCTLPATQDLTFPSMLFKPFLSFVERIVMVGTSGNYKETWQDILGRIRCFGKRTGRGRMASFKCGISWVCLKGCHIRGGFLLFLLDDRPFLLLSLFF